MNVLGSGLKEPVQRPSRSGNSSLRTKGSGGKRSGFDKREGIRKGQLERSRKPAVKPQTAEASLLNALPLPQLNEL